jgi:drug/metabolite transporter (DMT)-like permease
VNTTGKQASSDAIWIVCVPLVFVVIWSTGFIVAKFGMPHAPPMTFLVWRFAFSLLCFGAWIALTRPVWPQTPEQIFHLGVTGILMHTGYLGGVWAAVKAGMGAGLVALIMAFQPILTALWVSARGQRITTRQWLGLVLGFGGLVMVVHARMASPGEVNLNTVLLALAALMSITTGTLYQKRFVLPCDVRTANTIQLLAACLAGLPLCWLESGSVEWVPQSMGAMAWSVLGLTLGGSSLMYMLIQRGAVTAVASWLYLVPPCTALMAWVLFGEMMTFQIAMGVLLTAIGVFCVVKSGAVK